MIPARTPRRPSITEAPDAHTVFAADAAGGPLPDWAEPYSVDALLAHGYAERTADGTTRLTPAGHRLAAAWRATRTANRVRREDLRPWTPLDTTLAARQADADYIAAHYAPEEGPTP